MGIGTLLSRPYRVAIVMQTYASCPVASALAGSFQINLQALMGAENIEFLSVYGYSNTERLVRSVRTLISREKIDLICATSVVSAQVVAAEIARVRLPIPLICEGVADPLAMGLVSTDGCGLTGVSGSSNEISRHLMLLRLIAKKVQRIGLMYDPMQRNATIGVAVQEYVREGRRLDLDIVAIPLSETMHLSRTLARCARGALDALLILRDSTLLLACTQLASWCRERGIPLFTSDRASVGSGAAAGYGEAFEPYGELSAKLARSLLIDKQSPYDLPFIRYTGVHQLLLNPRAAAAQGLEIAPATALLIGAALDTSRESGA